MKIIHEDEIILEKKISLPVPEIHDGEVIVPESLGRKPGSEISDIKKQLIAIDSVTSGLGQRDIARIHGTSQALVSSIGNGYNTPNIDTRKPNEDVRAVISATRESVARSASSKLLETLDLFNPDSLEQKELPGAALKISSVLEKASQSFSGSDNSTKVAFIVMAPRMRKEEDYGMIDVGED